MAMVFPSSVCSLAGRIRVLCPLPWRMLIPTRIAERNPQSYVHSPYFPPLQYNTTQGDFYGGNFWDARATGFRLQNSAAEQGQDPPVDPEEMTNPDTACVVWKLSLSQYKFFFEQVWGAGSLDIGFPTSKRCAALRKALLSSAPTPLHWPSAFRPHSGQPGLRRIRPSDRLLRNLVER